MSTDTMSTDTMSMYDSQGNLIQKMKTLGIKQMKKSPSAVFSWPAFVTNTKTEDVMVPISNLVQVRSTDTIRAVLWTLIKNKVECVPVFNEANRKYVGFVDMYDLVQHIANAAGSAVTRSDFFQVFKRQQFADTQVSKITNAASKDHNASVTEFSDLSAVLELTVSANLPRVPVMSKQKVTSMISQVDLVDFLVRNKSNFIHLASRTIEELSLSGTDNVYTVEENTPCVTAFNYMAEKGVQGLAVVNSEDQFVDAINSFDISGLVHGDFFSDLRQPVLRYLSKSRILLNKNLTPVVCTQNETLASMLNKMGQEKVYRIFVIDENKKPVSVISLRDILKALHAFVPPQVEESPSLPSFAVGGGGN